MFGRGRGTGGGRGARLSETLQKLKSAHLGGGDTSSEERSPSEKSDTSASESSPGETSTSRVPVIGGRGKLRQFITKKKEESSSASASGESSPSSGSATEAGAVGGEAAPPSQRTRDVRDLPAIVNKQHGQEGRAIDVAVNYVRLLRKEDTGVFAYHVDFTPNIDANRLRAQVLRTSAVQEVIGEVFEFTGVNIFLPTKLLEDPIEIFTILPSNSSDITVKIKYVKEPPYEELIPFYNTMFRRIMRQLRLVQINRHYYDPTLRIDIPQHKLEVWPGLVTAILDFEGGLMLNCDVSHRVLRTNTARDVLHEITQHPESKQRFREFAKKRLCGCIVLTRYNNKPYRVDDILFDTNPQSEFTLSSGSSVSYVDYFKRHWNIDIRDLRQPMLVNQPKAKKGQPEPPMICLVPELSYMTGLTDDIRSDTRAMKDIASHTRLKPAVRNQKLAEFIQNVNRNENARKILDDWGLELQEHALRTKARHINPEQLFFGNNKIVDVNPKAEWPNDARNSTLLQAIPIERWVLIHTRRDSAKAEEFVRMLQQVSRNMGFQFANPRKVELTDDLPASYCGAIKSKTSGAQLVVIMTPGSSQREDRYSAIKKLCYAELAMSSQVVRANTINGPKMRAVCQNIALQITCKVGGQLWGIKIPFQSCMIVGVDVYHEPAMQNKSVVGMVASMTPNATRWYTRVYYQNIHEEISSSLQNGMISCLKKYYETTKTLPQRIFLFRDGVSDSQLNAVNEYEIPQLEDAITDFVKFSNAARPLLSIVVVQKRINLKMLMRNRQTNELENPPPGSIIDHTVCRKNLYDFYIISQHVNQGTVTPTHYITLYDKNEMTPDRMQRITYKMTHLYYNFPSTIRVPAPCMYAHKAAAMIGQFVKKAPCESLCDKLFYL